MDIKLTPKPITHRFAKGLSGLALMVFGLLCLWIYRLTAAESYTVVPFAKVTLHTVQRSTFTDTLVTRALAIPKESVMITSERGGTVTEIHQYTSNSVKKGDIIARLSNYDFVLQVTSRIADATEQINNLRNMRLLLEKERLDTELALQKSQCHLLKITKALKRNKTLYANGALDKASYENLLDEQAYWQQSVATLSAHKQQQDKRLPVELSEIRASINHLDNLMSLINGGLEQLVITSPLDGTLSALDINVGQQIKPGEKVANVDNPHAYYFEAAFSEYYLDKIKPQQRVIAQYAGREIPLIIETVSSMVDNSKFTVRLELAVPQPLALKRGQSIDIQVALGTTQNALLTPSAAIFFQGNQAMVYLYDEKQRRAVRTPVSIKRQGAAQSEVVSGLMEGQQVVTFADGDYEKSTVIEFE